MKTRDKTTVWFGAAILAVSVFAVGGAPRPVLFIIGILVALAMASVLTSRRSLSRSPLSCLIMVAVALTALQLLPLPSQITAALDPIGQELRSDGASLVGQPVGWTALSRDPSGTAYGLIYLLLLSGAALISLRIAASEPGRLLIVGAVVVTGTLASIITALHSISGATTLYGLYQPRFASPQLLGPLLNPNHLGCLFALTAVAAAALVFYDKQPAMLRGLWALCSVVTIAATLLTLSRGATLAMLAGGIIIVGTLLGQWMRGRADTLASSRLSINAVAIGIVATCGLALVVYTSGRGVSEQLRDTTGNEWNQSGSKYSAWRSATRLVEETPWIGIGRGAFETSFTRVHPASSKVTFSHPENEYVQAVVEWGLPGALLLAAMVGWVAVAAARRWRMGALTAAALGATAVVTVQSVVDFGLELPGIAVPTIALLATLVHVPLREFPVRLRRRHLIGRVLALTVVIAASALLLTDYTRRIGDDHRTLMEVQPPSFAAALPVIARHPHDYLAFAYAGDQLTRTRDPRAMAFLNHALRLHPSHSGLHRAAARILLKRGLLTQSALEYASAIHAAAVVSPLIKEVVKVFSDPDLAAAAIPTDHPMPEHIARVLVEAGAPAVELRWLRRVALLRPSAPRIGELLHRAARKAGDLTLAETAAGLWYRQDSNAASLLALGEILVQRGQLEEAARVLATAPSAAGSQDEVANVWMLQCDVEAKRRRWDSARSCLLALRAAPKRDSHLLLEIARRLRDVDEASAVAP